MKKAFYLLILLVCWGKLHAQNLSEQLSQTAMHIWNDSVGKPAKWSYDQGVLLKGIEGIWKKTNNPAYLQYIRDWMDGFVTEDGTIKTYKSTDYNIDNIRNGNVLLFLYATTKNEKYHRAAQILRNQLNTQPRTNEGGFWHKKIYPNQMWLDGLYMAEPFYATWSTLHKDTTAFSDIAHQFMWMENHARDSATGLLYHGWDESKQEAWANSTTGTSANFWARAMGWYGSALVDALEYFPSNHPAKDSLVQILNRFATAIVRVQDKKMHLWWNVLNFPNREGNFLEASAASMFVYALAKGVRLGYLPNKFLAPATKGYAAILQQFVVKDSSGLTHLQGTVAVSGLGGKPYRNGSYEYYIHEKVVTDDMKGIGALIQAANEMERYKH